MGTGLCGRLIGFVTGAAVLLCALPAGSAADTGRWDLVGRESVPFNYFQGIASEPGGDLFFDGPSVGLFRTNAQLVESVANNNVIPPEVSAPYNATPPAQAGESYNHLGDIAYDPTDGGRILLPLECYYPGTSPSNTCQTGSIGVAGLDGQWDYYVRLDPLDINKTMWVAAGGGKIYTQGGNGANKLLVYDASDVSMAHQATPGGPGDPIDPIDEFPNVLPSGQMTGAAVYRGRLYVAKSVSGSGASDTFQVWSSDPGAADADAVGDSKRLEIEIPVAGESEGLDVNGSFGGVLHWQIMPVPRSPATQPATYQPGVGSLLSFVPASAAPDIHDTDRDGIPDSEEGDIAGDSCTDDPGGDQPDGCPNGAAPPLDNDRDQVENTDDNCSAMPNNFQADADQDAVGDACDPDDDNDNVLDGSDNCQFVTNADQANTDGDAKGDACEDDDDNDLIKDYYDNCPTTPNPGQEDSDGDGIGDACEAITPPPPADTTPPDTTIGKVKVKSPKKKGKKGKGKVTIVFASTDPTGGTYECRLDGKALRSCKSPLKLKLKPGKHGFEVAAVDLAGNVDPTPAKTKIKVKKPKRKHGKGHKANERG